MTMRTIRENRRPQMDAKTTADYLGDALIQINHQRKQLRAVRRWIGWAVPITFAIGFLVGRIIG